ncbi:MAG: Rieske 2Fe-2S domain-containing protein [Thermoanaerobaculia bacterium]|nr:Rieske 2Fe-2S domain-containing protein [Thermoanaerobaculia bacterium]
MITSSRLDPPVLVQPHARPSRPPALVPCWYIACASDTLRRGGVIRFDLGGEPIVLFRGRDTGVVRALPAHCLHQGVDLAHGDVVGDCLRCPLHHWEYGDRCERIPGVEGMPVRGRKPRFTTAERFGMVFLHPGSDPAGPPPGFSVADSELYVVPGRPVEIDCPWYVPVANAFDMTHLETVHRRKLASAPVITNPDPLSFNVRYSTRVIGDGWSDRTMRFLSGDEIRVNVTCAGGTMVVVESLVGRRRGFLMVSLRPTRTGVSIVPFFGVPRTATGSHLLSARVSAMLFSAFLRRDVKPLRGIRFPANYVDGRDSTIDACYRFLCQLPEHQQEEIA